MKENSELLQTICKKENIGIFLEIACKIVNLKTKQIAEELMVTPAYVTAIFLGARKPSVRVMRDFLRILKITKEQFIGIVDFYNESNSHYKYIYTMAKVANIIIDNIEDEM